MFDNLIFTNGKAVKVLKGQVRRVVELGWKQRWNNFKNGNIRKHWMFCQWNEFSSNKNDPKVSQKITQYVECVPMQ